ncbi:unnamed protein product [Didymodactylos carnosus]|uniref:F-box domain-containing protein n=1 Tax=Didymodactylos carnosus TaxID=1234261 RepID=A0A814XZX7_9BILA|nr:unnamed protein product [Didymodactylos carnosus]CAF1223157.1 unnamed protein product [Didymodactylos carnosus]CAF3582381.1 unnamed protein product [Didymodactylos carnosus]CAF3986414.1 unnamed protein product [Didymodactylos carnosus]
MTSLCKLEYLPNELFYMIYGYLNGTDLVISLYNLNARLNSLISTINYLNIDLTNVSRRSFFHIIKFVFPALTEQIYGVTLPNKDIVIRRFRTHIQLPYLRSLTLNKVAPVNVRIILEKLAYGHLSHLSISSDITSCNSQSDIDDIIKIIFSEKMFTLKTCNIPDYRIDTSEDSLGICSVESMTVQTLNVCVLSEVMQHLLFMKYLRVRISNSLDNILLPSSFDLSNLISFELVVCDVDIDNIEWLLKHMPKLERLFYFFLSTNLNNNRYFYTNYRHYSQINTVIWRRILAGLPLLENFDLSIKLDNGGWYTADKYLNTFKWKFWYIFIAFSYDTASQHACSIYNWNPPTQTDTVDMCRSTRSDLSIAFSYEMQRLRDLFSYTLIKCRIDSEIDLETVRVPAFHHQPVKHRLLFGNAPRSSNFKKKFNWRKSHR